MEGGSIVGLIKKDDAVLVIIDMQERLVPVIDEKERVIENNVKLAKFSRIIGLPVIFTEQQKLGNTIPEIREELRETEPISKIEFNGFGCDTFMEQLERLNRHALIITGIEAHICVAQTVLSALSDYSVHVVSDAISSRSPHNRDVSLGRMSQAGATITSTEMVIYEILEKAGTDTFREVLKLVK